MMRMQKLSIFLLLLVFTASAVEAKKISALFKGTIDGSAVKFLSGEVSTAGTRPYLLISVVHRGEHWMFDIKGMTENPGNARLRYYIMHRRKRRLHASYRGTVAVRVQRVKGRKTWRGSKITLRMKSKKGKPVMVKGLLYWDTAAMPAKPKGGNLKVVFDDTALKPARAKIEPWNEGLQIQKLFVIRPGVTLNMTVKFPSAKDGTYRGSLSAMYFRMVDGKLKTSFLKAKNIQVTVSRGRVTFSGKAKGKKGESHFIRGSFNP